MWVWSGRTRRTSRRSSPRAQRHAIQDSFSRGRRDELLSLAVRCPRGVNKPGRGAERVRGGQYVYGQSPQPGQVAIKAIPERRRTSFVIDGRERYEGANAQGPEPT